MVTTDTVTIDMRTNIGGTGTIIDTTTIAIMIVIDARLFSQIILSEENGSRRDRGL